MQLIFRPFSSGLPYLEMSKLMHVLGLRQLHSVNGCACIVVLSSRRYKPVMHNQQFCPTIFLPHGSTGWSVFLVERFSSVISLNVSCWALSTLASFCMTARFYERLLKCRLHTHCTVREFSIDEQRGFHSPVVNRSATMLVPFCKHSGLLTLCKALVLVPPKWD